MVACVPALVGFVVPPLKVLDRWCGRADPGLAPPVAVPVVLDGRVGRLLVSAPGRHALELDGEAVASDRGPGIDDGWTALWRAVDVVAVRPSDRLAAALAAAGVDLARSGYARTARSADGVAHTLGARGEGEPELPQVWFARDPLWPVSVRVGGRVVTVGPPGPGGWPAWFDLPDGRRLDVVGPAVPWAGPSVPALPPPYSPLPGNWRRAF